MRALLLLVAVGAGCGWTAPRPAEDHAQEHEHDADDVPITEADVEMPADFSAAVKRLRDYVTDIKAAINAGTNSMAHRPLDEADIVIGKIMNIARGSNVPRADWEEANLARRSLRENLDKVHAA